MPRKSCASADIPPMDSENITLVIHRLISSITASSSRVRFNFVLHIPVDEKPVAETFKLDGVGVRAARIGRGYDESRELR